MKLEMDDEAQIFWGGGFIFAVASTFPGFYFDWPDWCGMFVGPAWVIIYFTVRKIWS